MNIINPASVGNVKGLARISGLPLYKRNNLTLIANHMKFLIYLEIAQSYMPDLKAELLPKEIFVPILNGSKPVNSKCKVRMAVSGLQYYNI